MSDDSEQAPEFEAEVDFWDGCELQRVMTDPPRYVLTIPGGQAIRLKTRHFFAPAEFSAAYIDVVGAFPPLPEKGKGLFLQDVFRRLLEDRRDVPVADEAGDHGMLLEDIRLSIAACPQSDDPRDLERGALYQPAPHEPAWLNARSLFARVARACPVKFGPGDFYAALSDLGLLSLGPKRAASWQGRVWSVPVTLVAVVSQAPELPDAGQASLALAQP